MKLTNLLSHYFADNIYPPGGSSVSTLPIWKNEILPFEASDVTIGTWNKFCRGHLISWSCAESKTPSGLALNQGWSGHTTRLLCSTLCPWASINCIALSSLSFPNLVAVFPVKVGCKCSLRNFCGIVLLRLGTLFAELGVSRSFLVLCTWVSSVNFSIWTGLSGTYFT